MTQIVLQATTTALTASINPSTVGQTVTLTATANESAPGTPTGTITFKDGGNDISGCTNVALNGSAQAVCALKNFNAGLHNLTAVYSGDANFATSTSNTVAQTVNAFATRGLFVSSASNHLVNRYDGSTGAFVSNFVPSGSGGLNVPFGLAFGSDGYLYVGSYGNGAVIY